VQLSSQLVALHARCLVHCDLKLGNVLLDVDSSSGAVTAITLADFGAPIWPVSSRRTSRLHALLPLLTVLPPTHQFAGGLHPAPCCSARMTFMLAFTCIRVCV
jgi:serine/threonine protein kinase